MGSILGASLLSACSTAYYAAYTMEQNKIRLPKSEFNERSYVLVRNDALPAPIYVAKEGEQFFALLLLCTHKACEVAPYGNELHCPCHGSEFDNKGRVLQGPAEDDLKKFNVEIFDEYLLIK